MRDSPCKIAPSGLRKLPQEIWMVLPRKDKNSDVLLLLGEMHEPLAKRLLERVSPALKNSNNLSSRRRLIDIERSVRQAQAGFLSECHVISLACRQRKFANRDAQRRRNCSSLADLEHPLATLSRLTDHHCKETLD
jgi:hypothetical protein